MQPVDTSNTLQVVRQNEIDRVEKEYLEEILFRYKGRITESARAAGIGVRQLNKLMQKYNLNFPVLLDPEEEIAKKIYKTTGVPETLS